MLQKVPFSSLLSLFFLGLLLSVALHVEVFSDDVPPGVRPYLVKRGHRRSLVVTEYGEISAAEISTGTEGPYHIQFITLEPNSLFLPVLLHADMVFYVNTGNGKLSWTDGGKEMKRTNLRRGDVYRLQAGSAFFVQSNLDSERQKMRIHAIFSNTDEDIYDPSVRAYSSINDLVLGFDKKILKAAFKVPEEVLEEITSATKPPPVVHAVTKDQKSALWELEDRLVNILIGGRDDPLYDISNKHKKTKETETFNILDADPDFENCNGWSLTVDKWNLKSLGDSNIGIFMVNLTKGSMMGPHWNPTATEIAVVLHGQGMVRLVCPSTANESECQNMRFKVKEGDVFALPRFHPMAQMSFNNDSFVFMGFSTSTKRNHPQFLTGKSSILRMVDRGILAVSFNVTNTTVDQLLNSQEDALILDCTSCAEEEEIEKKRQEEEARKREEERRREEEREKKREEEEARKKEEERKREEEARKREEEEARKREEEEAKKREEEARKREKEEREREEKAKKREEEEKEREEEEARKREEEKRWKREQEEAARERKRKEEEEKQRQEEEEKEEEEGREREEEEARKREEEKRRKEEEKRREQKEAERERERQEEEEKQRQEEEEQEEARRREEEKRRQEKQRQQEEAARREHEEEERQKRRRKEEEKAKEKERHEEIRERPKEPKVEARKEDQERKGDEGKGRRALRKGWKL